MKNSFSIKFSLTLGLLALLSMFALLIMACGGDATSTAAPTPAATSAPQPATPAVPAPQPTAAPTQAPQGMSTPAPTAVATQRPAATTAPAATATAAPTPAATAVPTAAPTAVPTATAAPPSTMTPVSSRIVVAAPSLAWYTTLPHKGGFSGSGQIRPAFEYPIGSDRYTGVEEPQLFREWEMAPDGKGWTFRLQEGVPFHSTDTFTGPQFTSKDFVHSWMKYVSPDAQVVGSGLFALWADSEDAFEIVNDYEVKMTLKVPNPVLAVWLGEISFLVQSKDYYDAVGEEGYAAQPIGTGPFRYVEHSINSHFQYEKVENHWRKTPEIEELRFIGVQETATRMAMLFNQEVQLASISPNLVPSVRERGFQIVYSTLPGNWLEVQFGGQYYAVPEGVEPKLDESDPLTNLDVRKALNFAIDRETINDSFYEGRMVPQTISDIPPNAKGFQDSWTPYPYDPEESRRLLAQAGYTDGFDLDVRWGLNPSIPEIGDIAEAITAYWKEVGVNANLEFVESSRFRNLRRNWGMNNAVSISGIGYINLEFQLALNMKLQAASEHWFDHPVLSTLVDAYAEELVPERREQLVTEIGQFLYDNHSTGPMFWILPVMGMDHSIIEEYSAHISVWGPTAKYEYATLVKR